MRSIASTPPAVGTALRLTQDLSGTDGHVVRNLYGSGYCMLCMRICLQPFPKHSRRPPGLCHSARMQAEATTQLQSRVWRSRYCSSYLHNTQHQHRGKPNSVLSSCNHAICMEAQGPRQAAMKNAVQECCELLGTRPIFYTHSSSMLLSHATRFALGLLRWV